MNTDEKYLKIYGGKNKKKPPFKKGDIIKQIWRLDENDNIIKAGREVFEYVGMQDDIMLIKTMNTAAVYSWDTLNPEIVKERMKHSRKSVGDIFQLHYKYADRFSVIAKDGLTIGDAAAIVYNL